MLSGLITLMLRASCLMLEINQLSVLSREPTRGPRVRYCYSTALQNGGEYGENCILLGIIYGPRPQGTWSIIQPIPASMHWGDQETKSAILRKRDSQMTSFIQGRRRAQRHFEVSVSLFISSHTALEGGYTHCVRHNMCVYTSSLPNRLL